MKIQYSYEVIATCDEEKGAALQAALETAAKANAEDVEVSEVDAEELEDEDDELPPDEG